MQDPNEDTEWNDILRQHGVIPDRPKSPTEELERAMEEAVERAHANRLEGRSLTELDELDEDGLEDEDFIQQYRQKRMAEIRQQASKEKYGSIEHISRKEYTDEVTNASSECFVVLHIASSASIQSRLLAKLLGEIAPRFREVKFVEIDSKQINEKFPSDQTPTIIVYHNKEVVFQLVTLATVGGMSANRGSVESVLIKSKAVERSDPRLKINESDSDSD